MPDKLDRELKRTGVKYVRYADDFSIYCKEERESKEVRNRIDKYLHEKLHLSINEDKSGIRSPEEFTILGYGFARTPGSGEKSEYQLIVSAKRRRTLKEKLKEVTRKTTPCTFDKRMTKLKEIQRGWVQYFGMANIHRKLQGMDKWVRNRICYGIWHMT
jgi:hypothetical protein